jgi:hypothetical protein
VGGKNYQKDDTAMDGFSRSYEIMCSRRDWSRMYFASRLHRRRMRIFSLSEKVNHILPSTFFNPFDAGYLDALEHFGTLYGAVDGIEQPDQQPDFNLLPNGHHIAPDCRIFTFAKVTRSLPAKRMVLK